MSIRMHVFTEGGYYHIYNRGNSKQNIFLDKQDYLVFQSFLYLMNMEQRVTTRETGESAYSYKRDTSLVSIGAYCLMPNHFHVLLTQVSENGISKFMQKVSTGYVMYFNKKYKRTGGLFEGKFKSKCIEDDRYLRYLYSYIHLNPLKLKNSLWKEDLASGRNVDYSCMFDYPFSSIGYFLGKDAIENSILNLSLFPIAFPEKGNFIDEIASWFRVNSQK